MRLRPHGSVPGAVMDFSVNTNPLGPPPVMEEVLRGCLSSAFRYPDPGYAGLREAIKSFYGLRDAAIIPTAGAAEALSLLVTALRPEEVVTESPTYGEADLRDHCSVVGCRVRHYLMRVEGNAFVHDPRGLADSLCRGCVAVMSTPNNPTGAFVGLGEVGEAFSGFGGHVIVDTAYAELGPGLRGLNDLGEEVIVVHSLTKSLAVPGLRAGFIAVRDEAVAERVEAVRQPWNVGGVTACVIEELLTDYGAVVRDWVRASADYVAWARDWVSDELSRAGYAVYESSANFLLLRHDWVRADELAREALRAGLGLRPASSFAGLGEHYTRVSIRLPEENRWLVRFLESASPD